MNKKDIIGIITLLGTTTIFALFCMIMHGLSELFRLIGTIVF